MNDNAQAASGSGIEPVGDELAEMDLTDEDILDAMRHISGYLDVTTEDFRTIYHLAHQHAVERLLGKLRVDSLMRVGMEPLRPEMTLFSAAQAIVRSGYKGLPVVDAAGRVIGMLTETDFLRRLKVETFLELMLLMLDDSFEFTHRCHETPVSAAMTAPSLTVTPEAGFKEIMQAFHGHPGRSMPVVDHDGRLLGMLLRKDFIAACHLENLP